MEAKRKDEDLYSSIIKEKEEEAQRLSSLLLGSDIKTLEKRLEKYRSFKEQREKNASAVSNFGVKEKDTLEFISSQKEERIGEENKLQELKALLYNQKNEREKLFVGSTSEERKRLQNTLMLRKNEEDKARKELEECRDELKNLTGVIKGIKDDMALSEKKDNPYKDMDHLEELKKEKEEERKRIYQDKGALTQSLLTNGENEKAYSELEKEIAGQRDIADKWSDLNSLIGSANGNKFMEIAQAYTFKELIKAANKKLRMLSDRYVLTYDYDNKLDFSVIDTENDNNVRTAKGLSGGESFIVSLSLALGLSSFMAKDTKIQSFFLDEGFGTLDEKNLNKAINALLSLKEEGKTIGIISHVSALKDTIPLQIKVEKGGVLRGPGVN